jgi:hypothetical protein
MADSRDGARDVMVHPSTQLIHGFCMHHQVIGCASLAAIDPMLRVRPHLCTAVMAPNSKRQVLQW